MPDISKWSDEDIHDWLNDLDNDQTVSLTDWELQFLESNLDRHSFSPKQRESIRKMVEKYGDK